MGTLNWFYWELSACGGYHKKISTTDFNDSLPASSDRWIVFFPNIALPWLPVIFKNMLYLGAMLLKCFFQSLLYFYFDNMRALVVLILDGNWRQLIDRFDHNLVEHVLTGTKMVKMCSYYLFAVISVLFSYWVFADHISYGFLFKIDIGSGSSKLIVALC